jgi:hypothetical protein
MHYLGSSPGFGQKHPEGIGVATTDRCGLHPVTTLAGASP